MHIDIGRPTRGLAVDMRYDETISRLRLMDFASRGDGHVFGDSGARSKSDKALVYGSLRRSRLARCMPDSQQPPMVTTPLAIRFWQNT